MSEITLKASELEDVKNGLLELSATKIPAKTSYRIGKLLRKVNIELADIYKTRNELLMRLGELADPATQRYNIKPENIEEWTKEITALLSETVTLTGVEKVSLNEIEHIEVKPSALMALELIIEE
jgi:hypothetical protein